MGAPGGAEVVPLLGAPLVTAADDDPAVDVPELLVFVVLLHAASVIPAMARTATNQRPWCVILRMVVHPTSCGRHGHPVPKQTGFVPRVA